MVFKSTSFVYLRSCRLCFRILWFVYVYHVTGLDSPNQKCQVRETLSACCRILESSHDQRNLKGVICSRQVQGCVCKDERGDHGSHVHARDSSSAVRRLQGILYQREQQMHRHQNRIHLLEQQLQVCSFCAVRVVRVSPFVQLFESRQCVCAYFRRPCLSQTG